MEENKIAFQYGYKVVFDTPVSAASSQPAGAIKVRAPSIC